MTGGRARSLFERLLGLAFSVLVMAIMLHVAARLLEEVWRTLAISGVVALLVLLTVAALRAAIVRRRYW
jgi:hypothetical protein